MPGCGEVLIDRGEGEISIASPKLMIYEVGNVLWKAVELRHLSRRGKGRDRALN